MTFRISIALTTTIIFWASAFVGIRVALSDFTPSHLALMRFVFASFALLMFAPLVKIRLFERRDIPILFLSGFLGISCYNMLLNAGEKTVTAGTASLLVNTVPFWTTILSQLFLSERVSGYRHLGMLISFIGTALILLADGQKLALGNGAVLVLLAAISQALYFTLQKPLLKKYRALDFTAYTIWFGTLCLLPFGGGITGAISHASFSGVVAVVFLGVGPAAIAYVTWSYTLANLSTGRAVGFLYFVPIVALLIGWLLLGEIPSAYTVVGGATVLAGVFVMNIRR